MGIFDAIGDFLGGGTDAPAWEETSFDPNLGLNQDVGYYNYDPNDIAGKGYAGALAAGERGLGILGKAKEDLVTRRFRMAADMIPGQASFRATPRGQGIGGGTSSVLARMNWMDAQKRGQEWAASGVDTSQYDLAMGEMPLRSYQVATPFLGMKEEAQRFAISGARTAEATNKQFRVDTTNMQTQFNVLGRMNQKNASWQARQARNNSILSGLFKIGGMALTGGLSGAVEAGGEIIGDTMMSSAMKNWGND